METAREPFSWVLNLLLFSMRFGLGGPGPAAVGEDGVQRRVVRLGRQVGHEGAGEGQAHGIGARAQRGQGAVIKAAAVAQAHAAGRIAHARHQQQIGRNGWRALGLGYAPGVHLHRAAGAPVVKGQGFAGLVHHGQADAAALVRLLAFLLLAFLLPMAQGRQGIELALDGPVSAYAGFGPLCQPGPQRCVQGGRARRAAGQALALGHQALAQGFFVGAGAHN